MHVLVPLWVPFLIVALATASLCWLDRRRRIASGHCPKCGYNLTGNLSGVCPECGSSVPGLGPVEGGMSGTTDRNT